jgi:regulatory protein YycI of two-component signal transduction system YycFG
LDPDVLTKKLLRREVISSEVQATGPLYHTGDKSFAEHLVVFDGGKSFGKEIDVEGGLSYMMQISGHMVPYSLVISPTSGPPNMNEQRVKSLSRDDYASAVDLHFLPFSDALAAVEKKLDSIGFPPIALAVSYSLDLDTMSKHYSSYLEENKNQDNLERWNFSKEDEAYLFHFRQQIDNIPVINVPWEWGKGSATGPAGNTMKFPTVVVTFTKDSITNINALNLYDIKTAEEGEAKPLIGAARALQVLLDEYNGLLLDKGTRVVSAELCYVSIPNAGTDELIPAWVFSIALPVVPNAQVTHSFDKYSSYVVNAITGEKMSGMR